jgi:hypothetical protein
MVVLRCSLPLALKLGVQLAETERHLERVLADEAAIRVDACTLPLYLAIGAARSRPGSQEPRA